MKSNFRNFFNNLSKTKKGFFTLTTLSTSFYLMNQLNKISFDNNRKTLECRDKEALKTITKTISCYEEINPESLEQKYKNLIIVKSKAFKNLVNNIRDKKVETSEFRKYSKRLIRILLEEALATEYTEEVIKESPCGYYRSFINPNNSNDYIAVSILRSGDAILDELLNIMPDVQIGKILVQRNEKSHNKEAIYFFDKLPSDITEKKAIVVDPMIATGGSAIASIEILIKKGIKEENIIFVNIISCEDGIKALFNQFPNLKMITGICDPELLKIKFIAPGLGDFGDRFYGTH